MGEWIRVEDGLPEERETMFAKFWGTDRWKNGMFRYRSATVIVCVEFEDGTRLVKPAYTVDGAWRFPFALKHHRITHWMPLPEPPEMEAEDESGNPFDPPAAGHLPFQGRL